MSILTCAECSAILTDDAHCDSCVTEMQESLQAQLAQISRDNVRLEADNMSMAGEMAVLRHHPVDGEFAETRLELEQCRAALGRAMEALVKHQNTWGETRTGASGSTYTKLVCRYCRAVDHTPDCIMVNPTAAAALTERQAMQAVIEAARVLKAYWIRLQYRMLFWPTEQALVDALDAYEAQTKGTR